jgi:hypothetical protein
MEVIKSGTCEGRDWAFLKVKNEFLFKVCSAAA